MNGAHKDKMALNCMDLSLSCHFCYDIRHLGSRLCAVSLRQVSKHRRSQYIVPSDVLKQALSGGVNVCEALEFHSDKAQCKTTFEGSVFSDQSCALHETVIREVMGGHDIIPLLS